MNFLKKAFASKEVKAALGIIEEAAYRFQTETFAFEQVRMKMERWLLANQNAFVRLIRESGGRTPREWVYSQIGNVAGDLLESGEYHVYRGALKPMGRDLLKMFDAAHDELLQIKAADESYVIEQKAVIRKNIQSAG